MMTSRTLQPRPGQPIYLEKGPSGPQDDPRAEWIDDRYSELYAWLTTDPSYEGAACLDDLTARRRWHEWLQAELTAHEANVLTALVLRAPAAAVSVLEDALRRIVEREWDEREREV